MWFWASTASLLDQGKLSVEYDKSIQKFLKENNEYRFTNEDKEDEEEGNASQYDDETEAEIYYAPPLRCCPYRGNAGGTLVFI